VQYQQLGILAAEPRLNRAGDHSSPEGQIQRSQDQTPASPRQTPA
jgi:hypothetical protein